MAGMTPPPRSKEGTHPGRISRVWNKATPTKSSPAWWWAGRPTVRNAESFGGIGMSNKQSRWVKANRKPAAGCGYSSSSQLLDNWPDTGESVARARKGADVDR